MKEEEGVVVGLEVAAEEFVAQSLWMDSGPDWPQLPAEVALQLANLETSQIAFPQMTFVGHRRNGI